MAEASLAAELLSPPQVAAAGGRFFGFIHSLRRLWLGKRYEAAIAAIQVGFGCGRRTAERIYAGQMVNGETLITGLVTREFGPDMIAEALARLPLAERGEIAGALRDAAELVRMKADHDLLAIKLGIATGNGGAR
jgi:hypothetical protein